MCCVLALGLIALQLVPAGATSAARGALTGREADDRALVEDKPQAPTNPNPTLVTLSLVSTLRLTLRLDTADSNPNPNPTLTLPWLGAGAQGRVAALHRRARGACQTNRAG